MRKLFISLAIFISVALSAQRYTFKAGLESREDSGGIINFMEGDDLLSGLMDLDVILDLTEKKLFIDGMSYYIIAAESTMMEKTFLVKHKLELWERNDPKLPYSALIVVRPDGWISNLMLKFKLSKIIFNYNMAIQSFQTQ